MNIEKANRQILKASETEAEFRGKGIVRVWVRVPNGGAWPTGATVTFQEHTERFEEESTPAYVDEPDPDSVFTAEDKKFFTLVEPARYRLLASAAGFVAVVDPYSDNSEVII